ncbi:hypothetical protein NQ315_014638 [Exocentrus adspersus]|uniref:Uncharacterized protein n=1 Tax=Exocentrus adspersus TaxID=1586481 RepID=A0AAV8VQM2_9CUCU|nr:hypothetical protein NQ315_014638 [Exocentrus adspersus]
MFPAAFMPLHYGEGVLNTLIKNRAWERFKSRDAKFGEKASAWFITTAMKTKRNLGMGLQKRKRPISFRRDIVKKVKRILGKTSMPDKEPVKKLALHALKAAKQAVKKVGGKKNVRLPRIIPFDKQHHSGGFLPLIPLFAGLSALGSLTGGASAIAKTVIDAKKKVEAGRGFNSKTMMEPIGATGSGLYLPKRPLTDLDLIKYAKMLKIPDFKGVFMRDTLPDSKMALQKECAILNLDSNTNKVMSTILTLTGRSSKLSIDFSPTINLDPESICGLALLSFHSYNSIPNIEKGDRFYFYLDNDRKKEKIIEFPPGVYEIEDIEKFIRIKNILVNFEPKNSIGKILGFSPQVLPPNKLHTSDLPVNIIKIRTIHVDCNITSGAFYNDTPSHTIYESAISSDPGFAIDESPQHLLYLPITNKGEIDNITLSIIDQNFNPVNFQGEEIIIRLEIKKLA